MASTYRTLKKQTGNGKEWTAGGRDDKTHQEIEKQKKKNEKTFRRHGKLNNDVDDF
jgi:hypothetical protein